MKTYPNQVFKKGDKFYVWKQGREEVEVPTPKVVTGLELDSYEIGMGGPDYFIQTAWVNPEGAWNTKVKAKSLHPGVFVEDLGYQGDGATDFKITIDADLLGEQKGYIEFKTEAGGYITYCSVENTR